MLCRAPVLFLTETITFQLTTMHRNWLHHGLFLKVFQATCCYRVPYFRSVTLFNFEHHLKIMQSFISLTIFSIRISQCLSECSSFWLLKYAILVLIQTFSRKILRFLFLVRDLTGFTWQNIVFFILISHKSVREKSSCCNQLRFFWVPLSASWCMGL